MESQQRQRLLRLKVLLDEALEQDGPDLPEEGQAALRDAADTLATERTRSLDRALAALGQVAFGSTPPETAAQLLPGNPAFATLFDGLKAVRAHLLEMARGNLAGELKVRGYLAGALKTLQANLRHLTWQAQKIAAGDFTQRVDFMGEFAEAFNTMTVRLEEGISQLQRNQAMLGEMVGQLNQEIHEHTLVEQALRESEQRYRLLADHATDVIWTMDLEFRFTYVSPSVVGLRGFTPEEVTAQPLEAAVTAESLPVLRAALEKLRTEIVEGRCHREPSIHPIEQPRKDGSTIWTEVILRLIYDERGQAIGILGTTRNISKRKAAEDALARRVAELETALIQIKQLHGLLPICMYCKKIRDDANYWHQVESYFSKHSDVLFSHGICPDCYARVKAQVKKNA